MIAVGIAAVLASMAGYSFYGKNSGAFTTDKALFRDTLIRARSMARGRVNCVVVRFDNDAHMMIVKAYEPSSGKDCTTVGTEQFSLPDVQFSNNTTFSDVSTGGDSLTFNTDGGLAENSVVTVTMSHLNNQTYAKIYPAIGQIRIY